MQSFEHWTACVTNNDCFVSRVLKNDMKVLLLVIVKNCIIALQQSKLASILLGFSGLLVSW